MATQTGVDLVARIVDATGAGADQVRRSLDRLSKDTERQSGGSGFGAGRAWSASFGSALITGVGAMKLDQMLRGIDARSAGEDVGVAFMQSLNDALESIPVVGPLAKLAASGAIDNYIPASSGLPRAMRFLRGLGGEVEAEEDLRGVQIQQELAANRQRLEIRRREQEERARERLERDRLRKTLEEQREEKLLQQEKQRAMERAAELRRREIEDMEREEQWRQQEMQREQERRAASLATGESNIARAIDSRTLGGRAAAFLQERDTQRAQLAVMGDAVSQLKQILEENRKLRETWEQIGVVG